MNGLSVTNVDVGEKEAAVSSEIVLLECACWKSIPRSVGPSDILPLMFSWL